MKPLPKIEPMELMPQATPFDNPDWLFEPKHDGFRALAYVQGDDCHLVSRDDANDMRFRDLARVLPGDLNAKNAILDGEVVVLDQTGKSQFLELMASDGTVVFAAFDLVWLNGKDLRDAPLIERKELLRFRIRHPADRLLFVDYVEGKGKAFYARICGRDMEGMVCKPASSPYRTVGGKTTWIKVNNPGYSQAEGRAEQSHVLR